MSGAFAAWGRFVHRRRWAVLAGSLLLLAITVAGLLSRGTLSTGNTFGADLEAGRAADLVRAEVPSRVPAGGSSFLLVFRSPDLAVSDPRYRAALESAIAPLRSEPRVSGVDTPYDVPAPAAAGLVSRDGHEALVRVAVRDPAPAAQSSYPRLRAEVRSDVLRVQGTGTVPIGAAFNTTLESDLRRAELVSLPVVLVLLLLIFGSVVAGSLPLVVGVLTIAGGLGGTLLLARATDVSQYALNVVTLIGLGVSIDYSLFIVNRFREEMARGAPRPDALAVAMATAGRAVTFSGLTVAVGLSALLFYRGTFMASMGAAGAIVVALAVVYALTLLPALLAVLGPRVDRLRAPLPRPPADGGGRFWRRLAGGVMRRPVVVLAPALGLLLVAGVPFLGIRLANGDVDMLPPRLEARQGYDTLLRDFPGQDQTTFTVVVRYPAGDPLGPGHLGQVYDLSRRIAAIPGVLRVTGPVDLDPRLTLADYQRLYAQTAGPLPAAVQQVVQGSTGAHVVVLTATSSRAASSDGARDILRAIRADRVGGAQVLVTGATAFDVDVIRYILDRTPLAVASVVAVTLVLLFLLTGSVLLPLKAVLTNLVSISASFGALVWIFQQGHLSGQLQFTAQSIDPTIPVLLFAIVFGLSMDYEVLLVSRIQEEYRRTGDNTAAVAWGLARSGRLITGAAAIMVAVFVAFGLAEVVLIKAIGIGLAIAVAVDATIVRALVVPSVMQLLGRANWWAPRPLRWLHDRAGIAGTPRRRGRVAVERRSRSATDVPGAGE